MSKNALFNNKKVKLEKHYKKLHGWKFCFHTFVFFDHAVNHIPDNATTTNHARILIQKRS